VFRKNFNNNRFSSPKGPFPNQMYPNQPGHQNNMMPGSQGMQPDGSIYPQVQEDRLLFEIGENRRRINNLTKRIIRLENYLRIRDTSDYVNIDDDNIQNEFTL